MKAGLGALIVAIAGIMAFAATPALALDASSADDICAPTEDPCVIDEVIDVIGGPLDFGTRTVRVTGSGKLRGNTIVIQCGEFVVDVGGLTQTAVIEGTGSAAEFEVTAVLGCSGDPTVGCMTDGTCVTLGIGTCSEGSGSIHIDGRINVAGDPAGDVLIRARQDITVETKINANGGNLSTDGGLIRIFAEYGSIVLNGEITAATGTVSGYPGASSEGGEVEIEAWIDATINGDIDVRGYETGGFLDIGVGRDLLITGSINGSGGGGEYAYGGTIQIASGEDTTVQKASPTSPAPRLSNDGGGFFYTDPYGYYGYWRGGNGGQQFFGVYGDLTLGKGAIIQSHSGPGNDAYGGEIELYVLGSATIDGKITSKGNLNPGDGSGGLIDFDAMKGLSIGPDGEIDTASVRGGYIFIRADEFIDMQGLVDAHGTTGSYYYSYGGAGYLDISGYADMTLGGRLRSGASYSGADIFVDVCRLTVEDGGKIHNTAGAPSDNGYDNYITVRESMRVEANGEILADALGGGRNRFDYRDPNKPPVLLGTVDPPPTLDVNPSMIGCPVCGNVEIDQGESCDDGNTTSGDGCRDDCQAELCIAQTPGFPTTALCDDSNACTADLCDPAAGCSNPVSCEEGIVCTADACVAGACEHTPDDAACDDNDDCTDDICSLTSGCVHADLTGNPCDDGDICTTPGTCDDGRCQVGAGGDTVSDRVSAKFKSGPANDKLVIKSELPLTQFTTSPTTTGMRFVVVDAADGPVFDATVPPGGFEDRRGDGTSFRFKDKTGVIAGGISSAKIKKSLGKGIAKLRLKTRDTEMTGAQDQVQITISFLFGTDAATDECMTGRRIPCTPAATKTSCKTAQ